MISLPRCSPTQEIGSKVIGVSSTNISRVTSSKSSITANKEGLRDSCGPRSRRGIITRTSAPLRSAASLDDLSSIHDNMPLSLPSPKHEFRRGIPTDPIGKAHNSLESIPGFLLSPVQLPHAGIYRERGKSLDQFLLPSFNVYPTCSDLNLTTLLSFLSSYYLSSSLHFLANPTYSELVHSSELSEAMASLEANLCRCHQAIF